MVISAEDRSSLPQHFDWAIEEWDDIQPVTVALEDGVAVSICHTPAATALAAEAGVFTAELARGRGYAVDVVALWARAVREGGRLPMYGTTWENSASRNVARKLGLVMYGEDFSLS
ncbi:MAG: hypothetical protein HOH95_09425 [Dehalococcoidia bacterium]|nr:hypothetical protein [Dehalococcoidia bacterium]